MKWGDPNITDRHQFSQHPKKPLEETFPWRRFKSMAGAWIDERAALFLHISDSVCFCSSPFLAFVVAKTRPTLLLGMIDTPYSSTFLFFFNILFLFTGFQSLTFMAWSQHFGSWLFRPLSFFSFFGFFFLSGWHITVTIIHSDKGCGYIVYRQRLVHGSKHSRHLGSV